MIMDGSDLPTSDLATTDLATSDLATGDLAFAGAPDHAGQDPAVRARFARLYARPVVLDVRGVTRTFQGEDRAVVALDDISFRAHRRELLCVIGPSGCGKSTLGRILAGLDQPTAGAALLDGREIRGPGRDRGMVFQGYTLFPWRTVLGNVAFGLEMAGQSKSGAEEEASLWVEMVGLGKFSGAYPYQLSGGMKQRVAIARALANPPRNLIKDEPFGALDAQTRAAMQSYLLQIWRQVDVTIVFVTHDLDEAVYLADRVLVLGANPGRVLEMVEVPLPRPRDPAQLDTPLFAATRRHLAALIHRDQPVAADRLPVIRMTMVGDDVE
jgi:NitT/TauT family transport system ATP-binding protein